MEWVRLGVVFCGIFERSAESVSVSFLVDFSYLCVELNKMAATWVMLMGCSRGRREGGSEGMNDERLC